MQPSLACCNTTIGIDKVPVPTSDASNGFLVVLVGKQCGNSSRDCGKIPAVLCSLMRIVVAHAA